MKTLVVYFSRKGYVKQIAEGIAHDLGADLLALNTPERTEGVLGFWWCGRFGMHRWGMQLLPYDADVSAYEKVIICSPVWVFSVCAPVRQFLMESAGKIKAADYVLVHFSHAMGYPKTVAWMDRTLGLAHSGITSVCCMWGRTFGRKATA